MDKLKELIKKIRIVDFIIVACVIVALLVGFVTYKGYRQTADICRCLKTKPGII